MQSKHRKPPQTTSKRKWAISRQLAATLGVVALMLALVGGISASAQGADDSILIEADTAELDQVTGTGTYRGRVRISRVDLKIAGERVTIRQNERGQPSSLTIEGNPARFSQAATATQDALEASAQLVEYDAQQEIITLTGNAQVIRGSDEIKASEIRYDRRTGQLQAKGSDQPDGRVRIIFQADGEQPDTP